MILFHPVRLKPHWNVYSKKKHIVIYKYKVDISNSTITYFIYILKDAFFNLKFKYFIEK